MISDDESTSDDKDSANLGSSGDEIPPSTSRRAVTDEERQEIEDDLLDLQSSGSEDVEPFKHGRSARAAPKKSARQEALELLKLRRAGQTAPIQIEDDSEDAQEPDDEADDQDYPPPRSTRHDMFTKNEEDDAFLTDDGDDTLGAPDTGMPIEFTGYASMKAKDLFRYAVEWMVQKKINPAFQIDDEVYGLAFKKLNDEIKGLAGSKFMSAAWTQDFSFALRARPEIALAALDRDAGDNWLKDKCDACNRSGHPATWQIQFQGKPYYRETLEEVAGPEDSDYDSESQGSMHDRVERDADGRVILPGSTIFYVGK